MKIKRTLLLAGMALAAIVFTAPAAAQAEVKLTRAAGGDLQPGDLVTATSADVITTVSSGVIFECGHMKLNYEVEVNGDDHVVLQPTAAHNAVVEGCVINAHVFGIGTFTSNISNAGMEELTIDTSGTGEAQVTFTSNIPALGSHCSFSGNIPLQATDTTDELHVETGNTLTAPEGGCGDAEMHGSFTVSTPKENTPHEKEAVIIHFEDTA